ncbi:hypothetical protein N018_13475 [Pseudomonas syringae CC1557]|uniref:Uncharacterized protein n=1 Tax=Pseudomonas syringae CC1557 TaxID=1357279 RepID=W0N2V5_PSESX|nr:hypothetical protein N018_13475 [Pseudomonas syringae CC1557]
MLFSVRFQVRQSMKLLLDAGYLIGGYVRGEKSNLRMAVDNTRLAIFFANGWYQ